jgi:hypothetical protein
VLHKSRATKSFTVCCGFYRTYKILCGFTCYVEVNFSGHSRDTCVGLQHAACFKSPFGVWNLDVAHRFWKGGVRGWMTLFCSVVTELFRYLTRTTHTGHNATSASCCVNLRVYLTPKLSTIRVLRIGSNSVEILQYDPALWIPINWNAVTSTSNSL